VAHRGFVALDFDNPDDTSPYFDFGAQYKLGMASEAWRIPKTTSGRAPVPTRNSAMAR
jgi:hypothetical protein